MCVLGTSPNADAAGLKILVAVPSCTWISKPMTASQAGAAGTEGVVERAAEAAALAMEGSVRAAGPQEAAVIIRRAPESAGFRLWRH